MNYKTALKTINGKESLVMVDPTGNILTPTQLNALLSDVQAAYAVLTNELVYEANQAQKTALVAHSEGKQKTQWSLYVLELENDKWYVGISSDLTKRLDQHRFGKGAKWTQLYKPIRVAYTEDLGMIDYSVAAATETMRTKQAMRKYGTENVRGGSFCQIDATKAQLEAYAK